MKIKRFVEKDSRSAMAKVRAEIGPDAVILSSKEVDGRFELVVAVDFDESALESAAEQAQIAEAGTTAAQAGPPRADQPLADQPQPHQPQPDQPRAEAPRVKPPKLEAPQGAAVKPETDLLAAAAEAASGGEFFGPPRPDASMPADCSLDQLQTGLAKMREMLVQELSRLPPPNPGPIHEVKPLVLHRLAELGLSSNLCDDIVDELKLSARGPDAWSRATQLICGKIGICEDIAAGAGGIYTFVGSTGVGKTTVVAKLAAHFIERQGRGEIGLISTDCYRIGGQEQLEVFAQYLQIPLVVATTDDEIKRALQLFADKKLVLIDTSGIGQKDSRLLNQFRMLATSGFDITPYLVLSATSHTAILHEVVNVFGSEAIAGTIITKVDESSCLGGVIDVLIRKQLKLAYIGTGQRVPDDLTPGRPEDLLSRAGRLTRKVTDEAANDGHDVMVVG